MKKKIVSAMLAVTLTAALALTGCGSNGNSASGSAPAAVRRQHRTAHLRKAQAVGTE